MPSLPLPPFEPLSVLQQKMAGDDLTAACLVKLCLQRIDALEESIRAWVQLDRDGAIQQAEESDRERQSGRIRGPLHGIPVGIKDIIDVAGLPTRGGCPTGRDQPQARDACVTARLRKAGAIILGKTVTTQYAGFDPPITRNPRHLDRTPGGSSSGSAAAVAAGMCPIAIGTQTGGSITRPASFCGVAGCKPSFGRVSRAGVIPLADSLDHVGPMALRVEDLATVLDVISGPDPADPATQSTSPTRLRESFARPGRRLQLGVLDGPFWDWSEPVMQAAFQRAIERFSDEQGSNPAQINWPTDGERLWDDHYDIMAYETARVHGDEFARQPEAFLPKFTTLVEHGRAVSTSRYAVAHDHQQEFRRTAMGMFESADVLICPATLGPAPDVSTTGNPALNAPWSYLGWPTVSFPIEVDTEGLPMAVQLVGKPGGETDLFAAAMICERTIRS